MLHKMKLNLQEKMLVNVLELYREDTFENLFRKLYTDEEEITMKTKAMIDKIKKDEIIENI